MAQRETLSSSRFRLALPASQLCDIGSYLISLGLSENKIVATPTTVHIRKASGAEHGTYSDVINENCLSAGGSKESCTDKGLCELSF